jgi:hypothetical protein
VRGHFRIDRYDVVPGRDTGTARYAVRRGHQYRAATSGTAQYVSVQFQSDLASAAIFRTDRYGARRGGDTGTALRRAVLRSMRPYNSSLMWLRRPYPVQNGTVRGEAVHRYYTVRGQAGTPVPRCAERYCAVRVRTIPVRFGFGGHIPYRWVRCAPRRRHRYRTAPSSTDQYPTVPLSHGPPLQSERQLPSSVRACTPHYNKVMKSAPLR